MLPEIILLLFGSVLAALVAYNQFLQYKLKRYALLTDTAGKQHLFWYRVRFNAFLYLGTLLCFLLFLLG